MLQIQVLPSSSFTVVLPVVAVIATVILFGTFLYITYRLLSWLWGRLPNTLLTVEPESADKILGTIMALAIFPAVPNYAWSTLRLLIGYPPALIGTFQTYLPTGACMDMVENCLSQFLPKIGLFISDAAGRLLTALNLAQFPVELFLWFLGAAVIATQAVRFIRTNFDVRNASHHIASWLRNVPVEIWHRSTFALLVVVSFYLGLAALLAIPLFQDKGRSQQLTVEALDKALEGNTLKKDIFDESFPLKIITAPESLVPPGSLTVGAPLPENSRKLVGSDGIPQEFLRIELIDRKRMASELGDIWSATRASGWQAQRSLRDQSRNLYSAAVEVGGTKWQADRYYFDLLQWHQRSMIRIQNSLARCRNTVSSFGAAVGKPIDLMGDERNFGRSDDVLRAIDVYNRVEKSELLRVYLVAMGVCQQVASDDIAAIPERPTVAGGLGPVGAWTKWLLDTQQMPVVIIVGLVGFSLLGATVSRAVRAKDAPSSMAFNFDDLLIVVSGGMTAAIVVFLAAYGGLAVLGSSGGDPNPYVVFVTCLIGAVYSEDVWSWARRKVLVSDEPSNKTSRQLADTETSTTPKASESPTVPPAIV